jgi:hypothetical protein
MNAILANFTGKLKKNPLLSACVAGIVALAVVVFLRSGIVPESEAELEELKANLTKLENNIANSAQLEDQVQRLKKINSDIKSNALVVGELARNQQYFFKLETENNIKLLDVQQQGRPAPAKGPAAAYFPLGFNINASGDYDNLLQFMRKTEKTFVGSRITSATISPGGEGVSADGSSSRLLSFTVQVLALN